MRYKMKTTNNVLDRFLLSWKFIVLIIVMQFVLPPIATRGFQWEDFGTVIISTLSHAFIQDMYSYAWIFQTLAICMLLLLAVRKEKISRWFMLYVGCCYVLYTINQNVALTEKYGLSIVTINVVMMLLVAFLWFRGALLGNSRFTFSNLNWKTAWTIPVAFFCLWWPMDFAQGPTPDCNLIHLFTGGSAMAFCPMTPVFLTLLILSKRDIDVALLRVTAFIGFIIGCYNMGNFAVDTGLYLGLYHLPLLGMSLYALLISKKEGK